MARAGLSDVSSCADLASKRCAALFTKDNLHTSSAGADLIADTHGVAGRGNVSTKSGDNRAAFFGNDMLYFLFFFNLFFNKP